MVGKILMKKVLSIMLALIAAAAFIFEIPQLSFLDTVMEAEAADYASTLRKAGFTEDYIEPLTTLHKEYPNWAFEALPIDVTLDTAVSKERKTHSQQLIQKTSSNTSKNYYCTCSSCMKNGKYVVQEGSDWYSASKSAVKYYMNPLNFLTEKYIFQFESTAYNSKQDASGVETILSGTWMSDSYIKYKDANGKSVTYSPKTKYSAAIVAAAKNSGLSAFYLAGRIVQEVGGKTNSATGASGTNSTYPGIYNYYNIGANSSAKDGLKWASTSKVGYYTNCNAVLRKSASSSSTKLVTVPSDKKLTYKSTTEKQSDGYKWYNVSVTVSDTKYTGYIRSDLVTYYKTDTYNRPWTDPYLSIYNGAVYIANNFTSTQNTGYFQKFNVNPAAGSNRYSHEYMANVQAPSSESVSVYNAYKSAGILSSAKTFIIPVYDTGEVPATDIELSKTSVSLEPGNKKTLQATLSPSNTTESVTWASTDKSVATVNSSGKITAVAPGKATIKATVPSGLVAKCTVTVVEVPSTAISLGYTHKGTVKTKCAIRASASEDAEKLVSASVDAKVTIKSSKSGWYKVKYTKDSQSYTGWVKSEYVTRDADLTVLTGKSATLAPTLTPVNSSDSIKYTSDDKSIATVSSAGKIKGVKAGNVIVRATTSSGQTDFVKVKVKKNVPSTSVSLGYKHKGTVKSGPLNLRKSANTSAKVLTKLSKGTSVTVKSISGNWYNVTCKKSGKSYTGWVSSKYISLGVDLTLSVGKTKTLKPSIKPSNTTDDVKYKSGNSKIAKVSSSGKITALKAGTVKIKITTSSGKTDFVKVKVKENVPATSVSLGYTHKGTVISGPLNLRKSASTSAKVLTKLSKGTSVTVKSISGNWYKVTCKIAGKSYTGWVSADYVNLKADITLNIGKSKTLKPTIKPSGAVKTVTYKSANSKIAKVSSSGKITALKTGTVKIKVTTASGKTDFVNVKVVK